MAKLTILEMRFSAHGVLMAYHKQPHRPEEISLPTLLDEEPNLLTTDVVLANQISYKKIGERRLCI